MTEDHVSKPQWLTLIEWLEEEVKGLEPVDEPVYQAKAKAAADLIVLGLDLIADGFNIHSGMSDFDYATLYEVQENYVATCMKICRLMKERLFDYEVYEAFANDNPDIPEYAEKLNSYQEFFGELESLYTGFFERFGDDATAKAAE